MKPGLKELIRILFIKEEEILTGVASELSIREMKTKEEKIFVELLPALPVRDRQIIEMRYGLINGKGHTHKEIGKKLGMKISCIQKGEGRALRKLREHIYISKFKSIGPLDEFLHFTDLPNRVKKCFLLNQISTVRDLTKLSKNQIMMLKGFGAGCLESVEMFLKRYRLCLSPENNLGKRFSVRNKYRN